MAAAVPYSASPCIAVCGKTPPWCSAASSWSCCVVCCCFTSEYHQSITTCTHTLQSFLDHRGEDYDDCRGLPALVRQLQLRAETSSRAILTWSYEQMLCAWCRGPQNPLFRVFNTSVAVALLCFALTSARHARRTPAMQIARAQECEANSAVPAVKPDAGAGAKEV